MRRMGMGMKNDSQNNIEPKECIVPGCDKTLPSDAVFPICAYHLDEARDKGLKISGGVLALVGSTAMFVKNDGMKYVGKAAEIAKRFLR